MDHAGGLELFKVGIVLIGPYTSNKVQPVTVELHRVPKYQSGYMNLSSKLHSTELLRERMTSACDFSMSSQPLSSEVASTQSVSQRLP